MLFAKNTGNHPTTSSARAALAGSSKSAAEAVALPMLPKGPFTVTAIPQSWSHSLHTAQAKSALRIKKATDKCRPAIDETVSKWKRHILAAKNPWSRLTEDGLLECGGQAKPLAALIQERSATAGQEARSRVEAIVETRQS